MYIVAGTHKHRKLLTPKGLETRPTTSRMREALFNICQTYIEGANFLDLFAGSGAMGIEALSRGASRITFVDSSKASIKCIQKNLENLAFEEQSQVILGDVFVMSERLAKQGRQFDIIYADAPYGAIHVSSHETYTERLLKIVDAGSLLVDSGMLFIEEGKSGDPIKEKLQSLELISSRQMGKAVLHQYQKKAPVSSS
jgi:16S rRNA (guanine966-N2)-methyltransferase